MAEPGSLAREIAEIPDLARSRIARVDDIAAAAAAIRAFDPLHVVTIGRGSSDVVCEALARAVALELGLASASLPPSLVTLDQARLKLPRALAIVVSQSGRSPDIIALSKAAREGGALVIGILNAPDAPLAEVCRHVLLACAYPEVSVAATKSMTMSWLAGLLLIDALKGGTAREAALAHLPASMEAATAAAWGDRRDVAGEGPLLVLARGAGLAVAREGALKIRELAGLPCEAFSAAEFMHGPRAALQPDTRIVAIDVPGRAGNRHDFAPHGLPEPALSFRVETGEGPPAFAMSADGRSATLRLHSAMPELMQPLAACAALYPLAMRVATAMGRDPDNPVSLTKVTRTL